MIMTHKEKQLAYREERAEIAMHDICINAYRIDIPNHPVKDGYRAGFNEGVEYAKKELLDKVCEWLSEIDFDSDYFRDAEDCFDNDQLVEEFRKAMGE